MATNLTAAQIRSLFEVIEVPFATSYYTVDGIGSIGAQTDVSGGATGQAKTQILAFLDTRTTDDETAIIALLIEYALVRLDVASITQGSVSENVNSASYSPDVKRARIKELMQIYVPFFRWHEVLAKQNATSMSMFVGVIR